jgi:hypothetical protein
MNKMKALLLVPAKPDPEREAIAAAWIKQGGQVQRIEQFWVKPETGNSSVAIYGNETFSQVLAQVLGKKLVTVKDELITQLENKWIKREMNLMLLGEVVNVVFPKFLKSVIPKLITAKIYHTKEELLAATKALEYSEQVIVSDVIDITREVRVFVLRRMVCELAYYEGDGNIDDPEQFTVAFLENYTGELPETFVLDLGYNANQGWFIIEFNSSWGAGLNSCDPAKVLECIEAATIN